MYRTQQGRDKHRVEYNINEIQPGRSSVIKTVIIRYVQNTTRKRLAPSRIQH